MHLLTAFIMLQSFQILIPDMDAFSTHNGSGKTFVFGDFFVMPTRLKITIGEKFNRLTIIEEVSPEIQYSNGKITPLRKVKCKCDCGRIIETRYVAVKRGDAKSCGCLKLEKAKITQLLNCSTHGLSHHPLMLVWRAMKSRCYDKNVNGYKNYGARGIIVCDDWKNNFVCFYNWMLSNGYKKGLTIERINNNGNYEPSNCKLATPLEQAQNTRKTIHVQLNGNKTSLSDACRKLNINIGTIWYRMNKMAMSFEKAINYIHDFKKPRK